jgi:signal transduction histidine kinase
MRTAFGRGVLAIAILPWLCAPVAAQSPDARTVLTIHFGSESFPSNPVIDAAIRAALASRVNVPIDYYTEYLDREPLEAEASERALADYIRGKYQGRRIDVVIAVTDQSLRFAIDRRAELFPDAPIVFAGLTVPDERRRQEGRGLTGIKVSNAYYETLRIAMLLHPSTERMFVVANSTDPDIVAAVRADLLRVPPPAPLTFLDEPTVPRLIEAVQALPPRSLLVFLWHSPDELGNMRNPAEIAQLVARAAPVPVYGTSDFYIGLGVVGGVVRRTAETGARLGDLAGRIVNGERAQDIPVETARLVPIFDWRQIRRWGIDPSRLPAGADIQFKVPTAWEAYWPYIVGTVIVVAAQLLLIAALLTHRARRRRAEEVVLVREATLRTAYDRIRQLAGSLIHAQETARASMARDLHDGVCQELAGVSIALSTLKNSRVDIQDPQTQRTIGEIQDETGAMYEALRRLSHDLHPVSLTVLGLAMALKGHCAEVERRHGVQVGFRSDGDVGQLDQAIAVHFFRIAQEALRNGLAHGKATRFTVTVTRAGDQVHLTVTDNGQGFDVDAVRRAGRGLGLVSIEERAHLFGGDVEIVSAPRQGTTIRVHGPAPAAGEALGAAATSA